MTAEWRYIITGSQLIAVFFIMGVAVRMCGKTVDMYPDSQSSVCKFIRLSAACSVNCLLARSWQVSRGAQDPWPTFDSPLSVGDYRTLLQGF